MGAPLTIPFVDTLGLELLRSEPGAAQMAVTLRDELCNSWGVAHGGVAMTLLDVVMAHAARRRPAVTATVGGEGGEGGEGEGGEEREAREGSEAVGVVTVEMKTSFMRPGLGRLTAEGRLLHGTVSLAFCEATLVDADGHIVAHATGTFKYLKGLPVGGRRIRRPDASD